MTKAGQLCLRLWSSCTLLHGAAPAASCVRKAHAPSCMLLQRKHRANRVFYLSIPPSIFTDVAAAASDACSSPSGWTRVIVEKPFGRDSQSFQELSQALSRHLTEDQMFRIDHYLGKELIENLTVRWGMPLCTRCPLACLVPGLL